MAKQKKLTTRQQALLELIAKDQTKKEQSQKTLLETPQEIPLSDQWIMLPLIPHKAVTFITGPENTEFPFA